MCLMQLPRIIPIVKDNNSDISSLSNYRAITLSSTISKLFEMCLIDLYGDYLTSSGYQFGFKKNIGCSNAVYALQSVVNYHVEHGSTVNLCFLDVSKAFDKVNYSVSVLYSKLIARKIPITFLNILINWYSKCFSAVRWNDALSVFFHVSFDVRQGGVLSPLLFAVYVNDILCKLSSSKLGCYINDLCIGYIKYADDLVLITSSLCMLQMMINICEEEARNIDMIFNDAKFMVLRIGKAYANPCTAVRVNGGDIHFVSKVKYLGIYLCAAKVFKISYTELRLKFYKSFNIILSKSKQCFDECVLYKLANNFCKPYLLYGLEGIS